MSNPDALAPCRAVAPMLHKLTSAERAIVFIRVTAIVDQELAAAAEALLYDVPPAVRDFLRVWLLDVVRELVMPRHVH